MPQVWISAPKTINQSNTEINKVNFRPPTKVSMIQDAFDKDLVLKFKGVIIIQFTTCVVVANLLNIDFSKAEPD